MGGGQRLALGLPDALLALLFAMAGLMDYVPALALPYLYELRDELMAVLFVEGGFLMAQATLVDIATRLQKRPPVWLAALIVVGVLLFSGHAFPVIQMAWQAGSLVFLPLLLSIIERGSVLWRMPTRPLIEKIAARALIANRLITGLGLGGLAVAILICGAAFELYDFSAISNSVTMFAGAIYFGVAAFDDWRVRGRKFARKPKVLFRYDAMGIKYLDPV